MKNGWREEHACWVIVQNTKHAAHQNANNQPSATTKKATVFIAVLMSYDVLGLPAAHKNNKNGCQFVHASSTLYNVLGGAFGQTRKEGKKEGKINI